LSAYAHHHLQTARLAKNFVLIRFKYTKIFSLDRHADIPSKRVKKKILLIQLIPILVLQQESSALLLGDKTDKARKDDIRTSQEIGRRETNKKVDEKK
jgi:hypothetical protein